MVRGGRVPDMPGCRYHILRGKKDLNTAESVERTQRRSKFATKKPIISTKLKLRSARKAKRRELIKMGFIVEDNVLQERLNLLNSQFQIV